MKGNPIRHVTEQVLSEVTACINQTSSDSLDQAMALIEAAPRIFVAGAGRTGLVMRALGMRLMHLGKTVYVVSETTTPSITDGDLLILGSGSGQTAGLLTMTERTRQEGADILLFTTDATSPLADLADLGVIIAAPSLKDGEGGRGRMSVQPMGTLFEQSLLILCDSLILELMQQTGVDAAQMFEQHANLE